jgi:hypothetical protein
MTNLANAKEANRDLVKKLNEKLAAVIKDEIGVDDGRELPALDGVKWTLNVSGNEALLD